VGGVVTGAASRLEVAVDLAVFALLCVVADRALGVTWGIAKRWHEDLAWRRFQRQCEAQERARIEIARALHPSHKENR
jgi:hypothetical protein